MTMEESEAMSHSGGALSNAEAASLIQIILANVDTSAPCSVTIPDSPMSLADLFPPALVEA